MRRHAQARSTLTGGQLLLMICGVADRGVAERGLAFLIAMDERKSNDR